ncbi:MAG: hypothetical protein Q8N98_00275, partial [bacterium]|nr:hypothetical protein [bacterium]
MKKLIVPIVIILGTLLLGVASVVVAWRLSQTRNIPIAPTAPQSKPKAAEGSSPTPACTKTFTVTVQPPTTYNHKSCNTTTKTCVTVPCDPATTQCADTCTTDANCVTPVIPPTIYTHKVCNASKQCVTENCSPATAPCNSTCAGDVDCQTTPPIVVPPGTVT